ncbi:hydantoinase/oxoprolinase family protein [Mycobacterium sp. 21AC1]|uniref:hydantoinase/oxoprolinase family protein n=1 Tax=[Mycobacterium] appelbergii TaxID=2939269 RepID=UPI0029394AF2|nr:hydantoinase/oxoprolinase family protein [Mycobacterium sp. 21AC1]MDV3123925.1 hydantoinase/oxoprolinase family protein [Mycobacterium sp. 21AC1]
MGTWVGIDVGGTFTDIVVYTDDGRNAVAAKVPSTPEDPSVGFVEGLLLGLKRANSSVSEVTTLVHGSTVGTNAVLERAGARIGIITTQGFEDTLYIGRAKRTEMYNLMIGPETPGFLCPRSRVRGVSARLSRDGDEVAAVDPDAVRQALRELVEDEKIESLAISLLFSFTSSRQEQQIAQIAREAYPALFVSMSSSVDPRAREYERMVVTAMDAYLRPKMAGYIGTLEKKLLELGFTAQLQIMESHGGIIDAQSIQERSVGTLLSGLAGGAIGAGAVGRAASRPAVLAFDMGGTSTDVSLIQAGKPLISDEGKIGHHAIRVPMVDVHTIGAGGGSIAVVDSSRTLRVGPQSAGAAPGPAAYAHGGTAATVTDANVVLGYLGAGVLAGGSLRLERQLALRAVTEHVAEPLRTSVEEAAWGIHRIAVAGMAAAARVVSISRGHDIRGFALLACGGAGPVHACGVADDLGIVEILIPPYPGVLAAYGLLAADAEAPQWKTVRAPMTLEGLRQVRRELDASGCQVTERLVRAGLDPDSVGVRTGVDVRYVGQSHELTVTVDTAKSDEELVADIRTGFERQHHTMYGQIDPSGRLEITGIKVTAVSQRTAPEPQPPRVQETDRLDWSMYDPTTTSFVPATVVHRGAFVGTLAGPAIILQEDTTTVIQRGWTAATDPSGSLLITKDA